MNQNLGKKALKICLEKKIDFLYMVPPGNGALEILRFLAELFRSFLPGFSMNDGCIFLPGHGGRWMMKNGDLAACKRPFHLFLLLLLLL